MSVLYVLLCIIITANAEFRDPFTSKVLCEGETLTIPWEFQGDREDLLSIEWYFGNTRMMSVVITQNGSALPAVPTDPYIDRVSRTNTTYGVTNTYVTMQTAFGMRLTNVKSLDEGKYSVLAKILKDDGSGYSEVTSEDIGINVIADVALKLRKENDWLICYAGDDIEVGNTLTFYKDGFEIQTGINQTGSDVILDIYDHGDGEYYCSYNNPEGNKTCSSQSNVYTVSDTHLTKGKPVADMDSTISMQDIGGAMSDANSSGTGATIGIVVGVIVLIIIIAVVIFIYRRKFIPKSRPTTITEDTKASLEDLGPKENISVETERDNISNVNKEHHEKDIGACSIHMENNADVTDPLLKVDSSESYKDICDMIPEEYTVAVEDNTNVPSRNPSNATTHSIESCENMSNRVSTGSAKSVNDEAVETYGNKPPETPLSQHGTINSKGLTGDNLKVNRNLEEGTPTTDSTSYDSDIDISGSAVKKLRQKDKIEDRRDKTKIGNRLKHSKTSKQEDFRRDKI